MVEVKRFDAWVPKDPERFTVKPYDVITEDELRELRTDPDSAVHIILPSGEGLDIYEKAQENIKRAYSELMVHDGHQAYLYRESSEEFTQRGLILGVSLEDYMSGHVKVHEKTREKPLMDRIKHIESTKSHTGLVWLIFKRNDELKRIMDSIEGREPVVRFYKYGYEHSLWRLTDAEFDRVREVMRDIDLYVADGHHRIAAAAEYYKNHKDDPEAKYVMAYCASDDEVRILPYNRVIRELPMSREEFLNRIAERFDVEETNKESPDKHEVLMYLDKWYVLKPKKIPDGSVESLDVSILQNDLLTPVLNIKDPRRDPNIFFVGGKLTKEDMEGYVRRGNAVFFLMHPTSIEELERVADAGRDMPPKSTWFDPKLLTGLVFHRLR